MWERTHRGNLLWTRLRPTPSPGSRAQGCSRMPGDRGCPAGRHAPLLTHSRSSPGSCQQRTCFRTCILTNVTSAWRALCAENYVTPCLPSFQPLCQSGPSIKNSVNCPYPLLPCVLSRLYSFSYLSPFATWGVYLFIACH